MTDYVSELVAKMAKNFDLSPESAAYWDSVASSTIANQLLEHQLAEGACPCRWCQKIAALKQENAQLRAELSAANGRTKRE